MYFYAPPFIIVKETGCYSILDQLGGKYRLDKETLIVALHVLGKKTTTALLDPLTAEYPIKDSNGRLRTLVDKGVITLVRYKRKDSFNHRKVLERIISDSGKEGDILNLGNLTLASIKNCPYKCEGCYADYTPQNYTEIGLHRLKESIEDAATMGVNQLTLSGGEVTASEKSAKKTAELSKFAISRGIGSITIVTTGYKLDRFIDLFLDSGVNHFQISLDGPKEYNDSYKMCAGATELSFKAIKTCQNKNVDYTTNTVVTKKNFDMIPAFVKELASKDVNNLRLSKVLSAKNNLEIDASKGELLEGLINNLKREHPSITINSPFGNPYILEDCVNCVAGKLYAHIDSVGSVLPCAFMNGRVVGNINNQRLIDLWSIKNPVLKTLSEGVKLDTKCSSCKERYHCFGNCIVDYEFKRSNCKNGQPIRKFTKN
ncbi:MAG: radical SAM protein [archaeon]